MNKIKQFFKKHQLKTIVFQLVFASLFIIGCAYSIKAVCKPTEESNPEIVALIDSQALEYKAKKQELITEVDKYISGIAPKSKLDGEVVVEACLEYNRDIVFVLAQGQRESHFGTAGIAKKTNSVFNVNSCDGMSASTVIKKGHGFAHPNHSVRPYLELLQTRYLVNGKTEKDLMRNFVNNKGHRYATSKSYEQDLRKTYDSINKSTTIKKQFDSLKRMHQGYLALAD